MAMLPWCFHELTQNVIDPSHVQGQIQRDGVVQENIIIQSLKPLILWWARLTLCGAQGSCYPSVFVN